MKKKILLFIPIVLLLVFSICSRIFYVDVIEMNQYDPESTEINYVFFDTVYIKGKKELKLKSVLNEGMNIKQVFCIWNNKVYFSYQYVEEDFLHWCIAFVDLDDLFLNVVVDEKFGHADNEKNNVYRVSFSDDYCNRNGYYLNGVIVITDFNKLIEYDIKENVYNTMYYEDYQQIKNKFTYNIENCKEVVFKQKNNIIRLDKDSLSDKSDIAKEIIDSNENTIWNGASSLEYFFNGVKIIDDKVYLICRVLNFSGETFAIVFSCDLDKETFAYVGYCYTNDIINDSEFYIVPEMKQLY